MTELFARHGDLVIDRRTIPSNINLEQAKAPIVLAGHDTAPHQIEQFSKVEMGKNENITYLRIGEKVQLFHHGRHLPIELPPGDYHIVPLREGNEVDRDVED